MNTTPFLHILIVNSPTSVTSSNSNIEFHLILIQSVFAGFLQMKIIFLYATMTVHHDSLPVACCFWYVLHLCLITGPL